MVAPMVKITAIFLAFPLLVASSLPLPQTTLPPNPLFSTPTPIPPPIVYTIAGSDSGGGAGLQADLHAIHAMGCHGCSAVTCLTAQNSVGVSAVHTPPVSFLREQLETLRGDLRPTAIKVGMLGDEIDVAREVGRFLRVVKEDGDGDGEGVFVVLDPVMISTSGHSLIGDEVKEAMVEYLFPYVDLITPNKFEAEELLGRKLLTVNDVERGARDILNMGVKAVLIKGGHSLTESRGSATTTDNNNDEQQSLNNNHGSETSHLGGYAQDYFLSTDTDPPLTKVEERLCDGSRGVWLRSHRVDSVHTHGTGCTLSSTIAAAMAIGMQKRALLGDGGGGTGAAIAIGVVDACCIAKEYVTSGVAEGVQLGRGPGPVVHTRFANSHRHFPTVPLDPKTTTTGPTVATNSFQRMRTASPPLPNHNTDDVNTNEKIPTLGRIIPIVDTLERIKHLCLHRSQPDGDGITDVQLRIKDATLDATEIASLVHACQAVCTDAGVRLWINDYWRDAVRAGCFGVHLGQEDLRRCVEEGGLGCMREGGVALGISTHSYAELAVACGIGPSYVSLGPVFSTRSKDVGFRPQGLETVGLWRRLIDRGVPLVAIGGIDDADIARKVREAGADCVAVIGAVTRADDVGSAVRKLVAAME